MVAESKYITNIICDRLNKKESSIRIVCQEDLIEDVPREIFGKIAFLVITANSEEKARFVSYMHRQELYNYHIKVAFFDDNYTELTINPANYDFVIITSINESIIHFVKQIVCAKTSKDHKIQIWCIRNQVKHIYSIIKKGSWHHRGYEWVLAEISLPLINKYERIEKKSFFLSEDDEES